MMDDNGGKIVALKLPKLVTVFEPMKCNPDGINCA